MPTKSSLPPTTKSTPPRRRIVSHRERPTSRGRGEWLRDAAGAVLVSFLLLSTAFSRPAPAAAQYGIVFDAFAYIANTANTIKDNIKGVLTTAAGPAVISGANYFLSQLAYKAAVALTSDCPGQTVCWDSKSLKQSVKDAAQGAVGEFVGVLSDRSGLTDLGFDLCNPPDLPGLGVNFKLNLQLGLIDEVQPKPPRCDFNNLTENWDAVRDSLSSTELLGQFNSAFKVGQTPLSTATGVHSALSLKVSAEAEDARIQRLIDAAAGGGFAAVTDPVSGRIKSPAAATLAEFSNLKYLQNQAPQNTTNAVISGQLASKSVGSLIPTVLTVFGQTLLTRLWNNFADGLLSSEDLIAAQPDLILNPEGGLSSPGAIGARLAQSTFLAPPPRDLGIVDPLLDFTACPPVQGGGERGVKNCVMDKDFADAVRLEVATPLTVAEAIKQGYLHGDRLLSSAADKQWDTKVDCFNQRYCESNLKKLRAARIIPIGWEIAASLSEIGHEVSLNDVVNGFRDCNETTGQADAQHPWCHLIDPDWVLKAPLAYCRAQVFGPQLLASASSSRAETCVDEPSCVDHDANGNCIWGYCTEEQRTWRFDGDSCPAQFASCRTVSKQGGDGAKSNFLINTVGSQSCNADNVGCDQFAIQANPNPATPDLAFSEKGLQRFLNAKAENCNSADGGCTTLVSLALRQSLNLVRNGGFERLVDGDLDGTPDHPEGWTPFAKAAAGNGGSITNQSASGSNAIIIDSSAAAPVSCTLSAACSKNEGCTCDSPSGYSCAVAHGDTSCPLTSRVMQPGLPIKPNTSYAVSATFLPVKSTEPVSSEIKLRFADSKGNPVNLAAGEASLNDDETTGTNASCIVSGGLIDLTNGNVPAGQSIRLVCNFIVTNRSVATATIELAGRGIADEVQLEEGPLTPFHEAYGSAQSVIHAKVAPAEFGCDGSADDPAQCKNFAQSCNESEVGCESYSPDNGDPAVPGIVATQDRCPAECAGFATFKQQASAFDAERFPVYFIPSSAKACSEAEVGCSEFTNTTNEQRSYFSQLRICQKPDAPDTATFYSWEGSDTTGFQLRVWTLKESNVVSLHAANGSDLAAAPGATDGEKAGTAPCTAYDAQSGNCVEDSQTPPPGACDRASINVDPDCREFYDRDGNRHYRKLSQTIIATAECTSFRATGATEDDCRKSSGRWDDTASICVYQSAPSESQSCSAAANSCRAYQGDSASGSHVIFNDDFEAGVGDWQGGSQSSEAVTVGGHSLKLPTAGRVERSVVGSIAANRSYSVSFWARGNGDVHIAIDNSHNGDRVFAFTDSDANTATPSLSLTPQWRQYSVGPVIINDTDFINGTKQFLSFETTAGAFFDNILLKETADSFFVIRDSWNTPASCNRTSQGAFAPLAQLGCRAYTDSKSNPAFLKSFSNLCREQAVGCGSFGLTQNTVSNPYAETFNTACNIPTACTDPAGCSCDFRLANPTGGAVTKLPDVCRVAAGHTDCRFHLNSTLQPENLVLTSDAITVPADSRAYLVVRDQDLCDASAASCRVMGKPHYVYEKKQGGTVVALTTPIIDRWDVVAKKDDPTKYSSILCGSGEVGCAAWAASDGQYYFKDPADQTCQYLENAVVNGKSVFGWFRQSPSGSVLPCYPNILKNGDYFDIAKNGDAAYQGWVGQCTPERDRCEEFVDPVDTSKGNPAGKPYYFIMNNKLDLQSCAGKGSLKDGCVLFDHTSVLAKTFSAAGTYFESEKKFNGQSTPVVNCETDAARNTPACAGRCVGIANGVCSTSHAACNQKSDCSGTQTCVGAVTLGDACVVGSTDLTQCNVARGETCQPAADPAAGYGNDANVVIKVRADRECAQWFACSAEQTVYDTQQNKWRSVCTGFDLCEESRSSGQSSECAKWVDSQPVRLTRDLYTARDITWRGREYSGFSIYQAFPLNLVKPVTVDKVVTPATANTPAVITHENRFGVVVDSSFRCTVTNNNPLLNDCPILPGDDKAACVKGLCVRELTGGPLKLNDADITNRPQCRAYPEADSPFPRKILAKDGTVVNGSVVGAIERRASFQGANICEFGQDCECSYLRATYGQAPSNAKFVSLNGGSVPDGICTGGPKDGQTCNPQAVGSCGDASLGGVCVAKTSQANVIGWQGLCVDYDKSITLNGDVTNNACNLWLPVDQLAGAPDIFNQNVQAGFESPKAQLLYCQAADGNMRPVSAGDATLSYAVSGFAENSSGNKNGGAQAVCNDPNNNPYLLQTDIDDAGNQLFQRNNVETHRIDFDSVTPGNTTPVACGERPYFAKKNIAGIRVDFLGDAMKVNGQQKFMYLLPRVTNVPGQDAWVNGGYFSLGGDHDLGDLPANQTTGAITGNLNSGTSDVCISLLDSRIDSDQHGDTAHEVDCDALIAQSTSNNNCFAMKATFSGGDNPALVGIIGALCTNRGAAQGIRIPIKVTILLKEQCTDLDLLHDARNTDDDNVIWPSAVFTNVMAKAKAVGTLNVTPAVAGAPGFDAASLSNRFSLSAANSPFGPATFADGLFHEPAGLAMFPVVLSGGISEHPDDIRINGTDYTPDLTGQPALGNTSAGNPFACVGPCKQLAASARGTAIDFGKNQLRQLFAVNFIHYRADSTPSSNFLYKIQDQSGSFVWGNPGDTKGDLRKSSTLPDQAPKVLAVDVRNCLGDGRCPELGPGITVNNSTSGSVEGVGGRLKATLRYYAFADKNHMPIRRKVVDFFGGGETFGGVVATNGFYKNHRGVVKDPVDGTFHDVCTTSSDLATTDFGLTPETCDTYYFEDNKTYICNDALLSGTTDAQGNTIVTKLPACGNGYPCQRDNACVFKPRIHITDAWGVCNGNCGSAQSPAACLNTVFGKDDAAGSANLAKSCNYRLNNNDWTSFAGEIIVRP